jgi:hypothetical protein
MKNGGQNCHDIPIDEFMQFASRARWRDVAEFMPDDFRPEPMEPIKVDDTWVALRTREHFTPEEGWDYRHNFCDWRKMKRDERERRAAHQKTATNPK